MDHRRIAELREVLSQSRPMSGVTGTGQLLRPALKESLDAVESLQRRTDKALEELEGWGGEVPFPVVNAIRALKGQQKGD